MAIATEELRALQVETELESDTRPARELGQTLAQRPKKYVSIVGLFVLVLALVGIVEVYHKRMYAANGIEIGDIIEACEDYTFEETCTTASCNWNGLACEAQSKESRIASKDYNVDAEREAEVLTENCTITDGMAESQVYPCICGTATCGHTAKCTAATSTCDDGFQICAVTDGSALVSVPCTCSSKVICRKLGESCKVSLTGAECVAPGTGTASPTSAPAAAAATATPGTPAPATGTSVKVAFTVSGVDYSKLMADATILAQFKLKCQEAIADEAGSAITVAQVSVIVSQGTGRRLTDATQGGVKVDATVAADSGNVQSLTTTLQNSASLGSTVTTKVGEVSNINSVSNGAISTSGISVQASTSGSSPSTSLCASHISWGACFSSLTAGKTTEEISTLCTLVRQSAPLPAGVSPDITAMNAFYRSATSHQPAVDHALEKTNHCGPKPA